MRLGVFIQVRLGSTRLPAKALLPLGGVSLIRHVMRALRGVPAEARALLTDAASARALRGEAAAEGFELFIGPDLDVLARYCQACRFFSVSRAVRATGDNPLVSALLARRLLAIHEERGADLSHFLGCPLGTGVEVVEAAALFAAEAEATDPYEREHVTPFLYRRPRRFSVLEPKAPEAELLPDARVTVDTAEDFDRVLALFEALYHGHPIEADEIVGWLQSRGGRGDAAAR